jgi:hypothetical protein
MEISYLNIITFLLTTLFYYFSLKPALPYTLYKNNEEYNNYITRSYTYLAIYFFLIILTQSTINTYIITNNCGGTIIENMGAAGVLTFLPWTFIFGFLILILNIYPGFKTAFSDIIGYYYISNSANKVLTELLMDKNILDKLIVETPDKNKALNSASDIINRICNDTCGLINQMAPSNFEKYWDILKPLLKKKYQTYSTETNNMQNHLFELIVTKDNIGEAMWYIYTGLLLTSIVQLKITNRGCSTNPKTMEANYQKFLEQEQKAKEEKEKSESTTYKLSG